MRQIIIQQPNNVEFSAEQYRSFYVDYWSTFILLVILIIYLIFNNKPKI